MLIKHRLKREINMNSGFKKMVVLIGVFLLGCSLMSCAKNTPAPAAHPEEGYQGGFGGDGGHVHEPKE
jgi:hypothetical protein